MTLIKKNNLLFSILTVLLLALNYTPSVAKSDSLIRVLSQSSNETDQQYAKVLIARDLIPDNMDSARLLLDQAKPLEMGNHLISKAEFNNVNGLYYWYTSEYDTAIYYLMKTARLKSEPDLDQLIVEACNNGGALLGKIGFSDSSFVYLSKALEIDTKRGDTKGIAKTNYDLGVYYRRKGKYLTALQYQLASIQALEKLQDTFRLIHGYNALGTIYANVEKYEDALDAYQHALNLNQASVSDDALTTVYNNIASIYLDHIKQIDKAETYILKGIANAKPGDDVLPYLYTNLGQVYKRTQRYDSAAYYCRKAISLSKKYKILNNLLATYSFYGSVLSQQKKYDSAYYYFNLSFELSKKIDNQTWNSQTYFYLASTDSARNDFQSAYSHLGKGMRLRDSLSKDEARSRFDEMQLIFETQKKDAELLALNKQNELNQRVILNQNYVMILSFLVILLFVIMVVLQRKSNLKIMAQKEDILRKNESLVQLNQTKDKFFSIISHDMRGPFNALIGLLDLLAEQYDQIDDTEKRHILDAVRKNSHNTYNLLVNLLDWSRAQRQKISNEPIVVDLKEAVEHVFEILGSRARIKSHTLTNEVQSGMKVMADINILNSVLINLVNNAIKFTPHRGDIQVLAHTESDKVFICVKDNGIGIPENQLDTIFQIDSDFKRPGTDDEIGTGLGLILVKEFVDLMQGDITVKSQPDEGSTFCFSVPAAS